MKLNELKQSGGVYVAVKPTADTVNILHKFMADYQIPNPLSAHDLHATVLYSKSYITVDPLHNISPPYVGVPTGFDIWDSPPNSRKARATKCLVLQFDCPEIVKRHKEFIMQGGTHDYEEFKPHMTLSYDIGLDTEKTNLPKFPGVLKFDTEYVEALNSNKSYVD